MVPPKASGWASPKMVPPRATPAGPRPSSGDGRTGRARCTPTTCSRPSPTWTPAGSPPETPIYDGRAGIEADIKGDKRGLGIEKRRKKSFFAQEAVVLLSQ